MWMGYTCICQPKMGPVMTLEKGTTIVYCYLVLFSHSKVALALKLSPVKSMI